MSIGLEIGVDGDVDGARGEQGKGVRIPAVPDHAGFLLRRASTAFCLAER